MTIFLFLIVSQLNGINLDRADASGCEISYSPQSQVLKTGAACRLALTDGLSPARAGEPDLQFREFWIGIPQTGDINLEVAASDGVRSTGSDVLPVPRRSFERPDVFENDPRIYSRNEFYPPTLASVVEISTLRDLRVAKIRIRPAQYNPVEKTLRVYSHIQLRIRFSKPPVIEPAVAARAERVYDQTILNYPVCKDWRTALVASPLPNPFAISKDWLKIQIKDEGIYKITFAALHKLGYDPSAIDPRTFRLFNIGNYTPNANYPESTLTEIPIDVAGAAAGRFDKNDYILFYGRSTSYWDYAQSKFVSNPFTDTNCFWLTWGGSTGTRMAHENGGAQLANPLALNRIQTTGHFERDSINTAWCGLLWTWLALDGQLVTHADLPVTFANGDSLVTINGRFYPRTTANQLTLSLNQKLITTITFDSTIGDPYNPIPYPLSIPVNRRLTEDNNTFNFAIVGTDTSTTFLDYFDAVYIQRFSLKNQSLRVNLPARSTGYEVAVGDAGNSPLIFNISNPFQPALVLAGSVRDDSVRFSSTGGLYWITDLTKVTEPITIERRSPGGLRNQARADYYIVAPDEFYDAALFLERYRQGTVGSIRTVTLSAIYDDYGYGIEEPGAIKEFFKDKKPLYGFFAADGTYDYKNHLDRTVPPLIPPYEMGSGLEPSVYGESVAGFDSWFADFEGTGTTPDMALGRVTARSPTELKQFIDKLINYETNSRGPWLRRFILAADDVKGTSTNETDHTQYSESIAAKMGGLFDPVKVYLTEYPYEGAFKPAAEADMVKQLSEGGIGFSFFGHGNGHQLAHERALDITDVPQIQNGRRLPFCFFGSCGVGRFEDTNFECIAEELVRSACGAIGAFAATKATWGVDNYNAGNALFSTLLSGKTFGDAYRAAMLAGGNETYELFGDPLSKLLLPEKTGMIALTPQSFPLGGPIHATVSLPIGQAEYSVAGYGPSFLRTYIWTYDANGNRDTLTYYLPGQEFYRGLGKKISDTIKAECIVPLDLPRTLVTVADGQYTPQDNTGSIDILVWTKDHAYIVRRDSIGIDTTYTPPPDGTGPQISLFANGKQISNNDFLPQNFVLTGELSDPAGIRLITVAGKDPFGFYINKPGWVDLSDIFTYDPGSFTRGRFTYPVTLPDTTEDTIVFNAYDNLSNRTVVKTTVTTSLHNQLAVEKPLVYPNPARADAFFTFYLTKDAFVDLKIYTITGRVLRTLPEFPGRAGYNQIHWEGRDEDGSPLANGVYFYKLSVRSQSVSLNEESVTVINKFIVLK